jgi:hypothetical protein
VPTTLETTCEPPITTTTAHTSTIFRILSVCRVPTHVCTHPTDLVWPQVCLDMLLSSIVGSHVLIALNQQRRMVDAAVEVAQRHVAHSSVPLHEAQGVDVAQHTKGRLTHTPHKVPALAGGLAPVQGRVSYTICGLCAQVRGWQVCGDRLLSETKGQTSPL